MWRKAWWIGGATVLLVAVMAAASWVAQRKTVEEYSKSITPLYVVAPEKGADPQTVIVVFPWHESGYCVGQFLTTAKETPTRVVVNQVKARTIGKNEGCADVGSDGATAGDVLHLEAPLGNRTVTRAQDGKQLELRQL